MSSVSMPFLFAKVAVPVACPCFLEILFLQIQAFLVVPPFEGVTLYL